MVRPKKWNILLDFDKTVAGGHSGGRVFTPTSPMDSANQEVFKSNVYNWLKAGHNVAIITRGIDVNISAYFKDILQIPYTLNGFEPGVISIFAPDKTTFESSGDEMFWALEKTKYVTRFLQLSSSANNPTIFIDDTVKNVEGMKKVHPNIKSLSVTPGDYPWVFRTVNAALQSGGKRKTKRCRKTKRKKTRTRKNKTNI